MEDVERLRLEYDRAAELLRGLTEIRFRLLALVPTLSGAVVALVPASGTGVELLAIGGLGLAATAGVLVYELRNAELMRRVGHRVRRLERELLPGGPLVGPDRGRLFGTIRLSHGLGLGLVYGAALGGWVYLVVWGLLRAAGAGGSARPAGLAVGAVASVLVAVGLVRLPGDGEGPSDGAAA